MGYLLRKIAKKEWNQNKRKKHVPVNKAERYWKTEEHFEIRHGDAEFGIFTEGYWSWFGAVFTHYAPFHTVQNSNISYAIKS